MEAQTRTITTLEERCGSLNSTIEKLNLTLQRSSNTESDLRNEISSLQRNLMEISVASQSNNEKLKQVRVEFNNYNIFKTHFFLMNYGK